MEFNLMHVPLLVIVYFASVIIHEMGHMVFGLATGYKFTSFRILSFIWIKNDEKINFRRIKISGTEGQCLMSPPDADTNGLMPVILYNLGGVIFNAILAAVFAAFAIAFSSSSFLLTLFVISALFNLILVLMNGIPIKTAGVTNDGYNARDLAGNPQAIRAFALQMKINAEYAKGTRVRDMPKEWFEIPDGGMENTIIATIAVFCCDRLMDEHRFKEAEQLMDSLLATDSSIAGIHRGILTADRIFCELIGECRFEMVDNYLTDYQRKFMKQMASFPSIIRTSYAIALLRESDEVCAKRLLMDFEDAARSFPYEAAITLEREYIALIDGLYSKENNKGRQT